MNNTGKALVTVATLALAVGVTIWLLRKKQSNHMLGQVADEGYETAEDILFPNNRRKIRNIHLGPVHPGLN